MLLRGLSGKESACQCRRHGFDPWVGKILWRRKWQPTPVFLPGIKPRSPTLQMDSLPAEVQGKPYSKPNSKPNIKASLIAQLVRIHLQCRRSQFDSWVGKIPWRRDRIPTPVFLAFPCVSGGRESACNAGELSSIPVLGRSPEKGKATHSSILDWRIPGIV